MLRFLYQILDFFGSVFAILSPVCIIHWLIEATKQENIQVLVTWLDPFFHPLNSMFEPLFRSVFTLLSGILINPFLQILDNVASTYGQFNLIPPALPYDLNIGGADSTNIIPITQGLLGLAFTILFFLCSFGSQMLRATEQRLDVAKQDLLQRKRLQQLQAAQKKKETKAVVNKNLMVFVQCDFQKNQNSGGCFEQLYPHFHGFAREITPDNMAFEFQSIEQALNFCHSTVQQLSAYYATLRPIDPQPPFRLGVHTHDKDDAPDSTIRQCKALSRYAGENQIVLSQEVKNMLDAVGKAGQYTLYPLGAYYLDDLGSQELYRMVVR